MGMGGDPGASGSPNQPVKPNVIKPLNVWSALEKLLVSKNGQKEKV
jgi:hypothetical protein